MIDPDSKFWIQEKRDGVFKLSQFVHINEELSYTAEATIDTRDLCKDEVEECLYEHGGSMDSSKDIAIAVFKERSQSGVYAPH